ncbi:histone-lysine N-methyltransferase SETMAR-like [Hydra vulgaris]|uniref:Histone-lysine N-methyltransferase SETMAR-like n=1 Tax=Hydra vulgaris TaxID=6087 RepID=A0ABM4B9U9_HYDVU
MATQPTIIRSCLLYEFKLGRNATQAAKNICTAFGEGTVSERPAQKWFQRFSSGDESIEDLPRSGRPLLVDEDELKDAVESDSSQTCQELAVRFAVSVETIRLHLHAIGKAWKLSRWVPHKLSIDNKKQRLTICTSLLSRHNVEPFLDRLLTCDEKWIVYNNTKRCYHWLSPDDPIPKTPKPNLHERKVLLCIWWTTAGVVHYELLPTGQTITGLVYSAQLQRVHDLLLVKQPALVHRRGVLLLHDNARPHTARVTQDKLQSLGWESLPHPPYSPDLSPTDFHFFLSLGNHLKGQQFRDQDAVEMELKAFIDSKDREFFRSGINKLVLRWEKVLGANGDYFDE